MEITTQSHDFCDLKQQLFDQYRKNVLRLPMHKRRKAASRLADPAKEFLCAVESKNRLSHTIVQLILVNTTVDPAWNLADAAKVFHQFEKYVWNLLTYPWKQEFWTIRVSSTAFTLSILKHFIESCFMCFKYYRCILFCGGLREWCLSGK